MSAPTIFDPTILNDALTSLRDYVFQAINQNGTPFISLGLRLFTAIAIIMIVIAGARVIFRADANYSKLATLLGIIMCVWAMVTLYTTPSSLLGGYSFSELIPRGSFALADTIGADTKTALLDKLNEIGRGVSNGGGLSLLHLQDGFAALFTMLLIAVLELAMFIVIAYGYIALGACLIIGPIQIPFLLIPKLDFLFWSWLKAMIKYAMYPLIGNIVILVICRLMLVLLNTAALQQNVTAGGIVVRFEQLPLLALIFIAGIYAVFKTPTLVSDIFSGSSTGGHGVQQAVTSAITAAVL